MHLWVVGGLGFVFCAFSLGIQSSRLLGVLLCLEGLTLCVLLSVLCTMPLMFISLAVVESAIGLSLMSTLARTMGSDLVCTSE